MTLTTDQAIWLLLASAFCGSMGLALALIWIYRRSRPQGEALPLTPVEVVESETNVLTKDSAGLGRAQEVSWAVPLQEAEPLLALQSGKVQPQAQPAPVAGAQPSISEEQRRAILAALRVLAGQDDNAQSLDNVGFNRDHTGAGKWLAAKASLTATEAEVGRELVRYYKRQVLGHDPELYERATAGIKGRCDLSKAAIEARLPDLPEEPKTTKSAKPPVKMPPLDTSPAQDSGRNRGRSR